RGQYVAIAQEAVDDGRLSMCARGLHHYLLGRPDNWEARIPQLADAARTSEYAVRRWMKELEEAGYAELLTSRGERGRVSGKTWMVYEIPALLNAARAARAAGPEAPTDVADFATSVEPDPDPPTDVAKSPSSGNHRHRQITDIGDFEPIT